MAYLKTTLDPYFMNQLPFSLREISRLFYLNESLDTLIDMRLNAIPSHYQSQYGFSKTQWHEIINAVLLTRLSLIKLMDLSQQELELLYRILLFSLGSQADDWAFLCQKLEKVAPNFYQWVAQLRKLLGEKKDSTN